MKKITEPELLVNDAHGIYIPKNFVDAYESYIINPEKHKDDIAIIKQGPEHEEYWDAWDSMLNDLQVNNDHGQIMSVGYLPESCDLWAIPEGYEYPE